MILIDDRKQPETEPEKVETPEVLHAEKPEPKKSSNNALIWGIVIVVLIVGIMIIINLYNRSKNEPSN